MSSLTSRSLAYLRELGYQAKVVEHWKDLLTLKPGEPVLVVQATTGSTHAARRTKLQEAGFETLWASGRGHARSVVLGKAGAEGQSENLVRETRGVVGP